MAITGMIAVATAALAVTSAAASTSRSAVAYGTTSPAPSGTDILNLALQLECLDAEFYSYAVFGKGLTEKQLGGGPKSIGGRKATLSPLVSAIAQNIAEDEIAHVDFLRAALGDAAVPCPEMDIGPAFINAADATLEPEFDPYANDIFFLHAAFLFEDVGVTAYKGAVGPLSTLVDTDTLTAAVGILAVEAYHAGIIRDQLYTLSATETTPYGPIPAVVQAFSERRDNADGLSDLDQGIFKGGDSKNAPTLVPVDGNAIVYSRTAEQVLGITYLTGDSQVPGGFYPKGLNGYFAPAQVKQNCAARYRKCGGGKNYAGPTCCEKGLVCTKRSELYSQCL